jgi:hypothetical protein
MAGKLSPVAQQQLAVYEGFTQEVGRIHSLVEQFATAKTGHENLRAMIKRSAGMSKLKFMTQGLAQLSQICGSIEMAAGRGGPPAAAARGLRELVGQLKFQVELGIRGVMRDDEEYQVAKKKKKEELNRAASEE